MTAKSLSIYKNKIIKNKKGSIIKFVNKKNKFFKSFGEIYFSEIKKGTSKGWNYHKKYTCIITVQIGKAEFKIFGPKKKLEVKYITKKDTLVIPPKHWFSFKSKASKTIISNMINGVHSEQETEKSDLISGIKIR